MVTGVGESRDQCHRQHSKEQLRESRAASISIKQRAALARVHQQKEESNFGESKSTKSREQRRRSNTAEREGSVDDVRKGREAENLGWDLGVEGFHKQFQILESF
ncbi:hypothetical protein SLEP1_g42786 [Rubroshorea leprosula]|uniref:Uncharacterized protein n=1 Tax=Rubroshorea leprosula TaxID=152421 RepID=A0AAV5LB74_9ROSI|nr:hypothetical protein SLEP1_g42786 [Rubroshorea leprosula]